MPNIKGLNTTIEQFVRFSKNFPEISLIIVESKKELSQAEKEISLLEYVRSGDDKDVFRYLEKAKKTYIVLESDIPDDLFDLFGQYREGHIMIELEGKGQVIYPDYTNCSLVLMIREKDLESLERGNKNLLKLVGPTMRFGRSGAWEMNQSTQQTEQEQGIASAASALKMTETQTAQFSNNINKLFGFSVQFLQHEERSYVTSQDDMPAGRLTKISNMKDLVEQFKAFHMEAKRVAFLRSGGNIDLRILNIDDNRDPQRVVAFLKNNYRNDVYITWRQALRHLYIDKFSDQVDRNSLYGVMQALGFLPMSIDAGDEKVGLEEEQKKDLIQAINALLKKLEESGKVPQEILSLEVSLSDLPIAKQIETAKRLLGADRVIGPDQAGELFGVEMVEENIVNIPFSQSDLQRAKDLGGFLVYRLNTMRDGRPLTIEALNTIFHDPEKETSREFLSDTGWYRSDPFYAVQTPATGWALILESTLHKTGKKKYHEQTAAMIQYLRREVFAERRMPAVYEESIVQFETMRKTLKHSKKEILGKYIVDLQITKDTRPSAVEVIYDMIVLRKLREQKDEDGVYGVWTRTMDKQGNIVEVSNYHPSGVDMSSWKGDHRSICSFFKDSIIIVVDVRFLLV